MACFYLFQSLGYIERIFGVLLMSWSKYRKRCLLWFDGQKCMEIIVACFVWFLLVWFSCSKLCKYLLKMALDKRSVSKQASKNDWQITNQYGNRCAFESSVWIQWFQIGCGNPAVCFFSASLYPLFGHLDAQVKDLPCCFEILLFYSTYFP